MMRLSLFAWPFVLMACSGGAGDDGAAGGDAGGGASAGGQSGGGGAGAASSDAGPTVPDAATGDLGPLPALEAVSGDLTFVERFRAGDPESGHLYSIQTDGRLRLRLTADAADWGAHAVGPDRRYIAAIRRRSGDGAGEVWIVDVSRQESWAISPPGCDARDGGVGWRDQVQVMFSAACDGEPGAVFLAAFDDRTRDPSRLLPVAAGEEPVREVFPAVGTSLFAFAADHEVCSGGRCFPKPQIWVADVDSDVRCQLTDGDLGFDDAETFTGSDVRLGDRQPAFSVDLRAVTFARNVGGKGSGPDGHLDPFRVGLDFGALYGGRPTCALSASETNLNERLVMDTYPLPDGSTGPASETFPQLATAGGAIAGGILLVARRPEQHFGEVVFVDLAGNRSTLSTPGAEAVAARWITPQFDTSGIR
jgi:hypothetical protein